MELLATDQVSAALTMVGEQACSGRDAEVARVSRKQPFCAATGCIGSMQAFFSANNGNRVLELCAMPASWDSRGKSMH
jgi:hypothetical protein